MLWLPIVTHTGADPGFPIGGGANPPGGCQHIILQNFAKKLHETEKILGCRGHAPGVPPKSTTAV